MIVAVLLITALSLGLVLLGAYLSGRLARDTIALLNSTRRELRPALVQARSDAQRAQEIRTR